MLTPHAVDIAVTISSLIAYYVSHLPNHLTAFSLRQVKLCIGQRKCKQRFTTQGRKDLVFKGERLVVGDDFHLGLLAERNTPFQGVGSSPVQRLMNRRTRTLLPSTSTLLEPRTLNSTNEREKLKDV